MDMLLHTVMLVAVAAGTGAAKTDAGADRKAAGLKVIPVPAPARAPDAGAADARPPAAAPDAGGEVVALKAVNQLLAMWLEAQNRGDFASYQALYAPAFRGVRRSGSRTVEMDRAGWMVDRRRMFAHAMTVAVRDVRARRKGPRFMLTFTQEWSSGTYHDVGPKEMVLVDGAEGLRIEREEMLLSMVEPKPAEAAVPIGSDGEAEVIADERLCHAGEAPACEKAATRLADRGGPEDVVRALDLLGRCRDKHLCLTHATLLRKPSPLYDPPRALEMLATMCRSWNDGYQIDGVPYWQSPIPAQSCRDAADMLERADGVPRDDKRAQRLRKTVEAIEKKQANPAEKDPTSR
jgi:hypothetical protein